MVFLLYEDCTFNTEISPERQGIAHKTRIVKEILA
jgi:hypothetical protein